MLMNNALRLAAFSLDRKNEVAYLRKWISEEAIERAGACFGTSLLNDTLNETTDIQLLRAFRDRLLYGDAISLVNLNAMIREPFIDYDNVVATLRVGAFTNDPFVSEVEIKYSVNGLELYGGPAREYLDGEHWQSNGMLLAYATVRIMNGCPNEKVVLKGPNTGGKNQSFKIASDEVAALILERGEPMLERILEIINEREAADANVIASILDSEAQGLSGGEL